MISGHEVHAGFSRSEQCAPGRRTRPHVNDSDIFAADQLCQRAGIGVIVGEAIDMVVERVDAGGRANSGLPHRTAEALLPAPDIVDEIAGARDHAADRRAETL